MIFLVWISSCTDPCCKWFACTVCEAEIKQGYAALAKPLHPTRRSRTARRRGNGHFPEEKARSTTKKRRQAKRWLKLRRQGRWGEKPEERERGRYTGRVEKA